MRRPICIWTNAVSEVFPGDNLTVFHRVPAGPEHTLQGVELYFPNTELSEDEEAVIEFVHTIRMEDVPLRDSVKKGLRSKGYRQGRLYLTPAEQT